jgi:hypothetical protein
MYDKQLLKYAISHSEWHSVAFIMDCIASAYLEGEIEHAAIDFNTLIQTIPDEALKILKEISVFDCVKTLCGKLILQHKCEQHLFNIANG